MTPVRVRLPGPVKPAVPADTLFWLTVTGLNCVLLLNAGVVSCRAVVVAVELEIEVDADLFEEVALNREEPCLDVDLDRTRFTKLFEQVEDRRSDFPASA